MHSHAALPTPIALPNGLCRVFFSARDELNRSSIGWLDVAFTPEPRVLRVSDVPVLSPGVPGGFDDSGIGIGSIVAGPNRTSRIYYMGWNISALVPWRNSIGIAMGDLVAPDFHRFSKGPIMDRSPEDPFTLSYPWVLATDSTWHMWYGSNLDWGATKADMNHVIKHAISQDGLNWHRDGRVAVGFVHDGEYAIARPCVVRDGNLWRMWYAFRGEAYRIGYAESRDGETWSRKDAEAGIEPALDGWDSEMICYPCVFDFFGKRYLFYNGNNYGKTGFGVAVLEPD